MPLQNRVTPFGEIVATPARGLFVGNRGIIHDPASRTLLRRRWTTRTWLVCACDFEGRRRDVMTRRSWTELFFLDEATALAAGHRPCFRCRRAAALRFRDAWAKADRVAPPYAAAMDAALHRERLDGARKRLHPLGVPPEALPDGAMVACAAEAFLVAGGRPHLWSHAGYRPASMPRRLDGLLTPPSTLAVLRAGYVPVLHPSWAACARADFHQ